MKRIMAGVAAVLFLSGAGEMPIPRTTVRFYGAGNESCAHWLSSHLTEEEGIAWTMGFWSGMNVMNGKNHLVGTTTDGDAVVGEVKLICQKEPSTNLNVVVGEVYSRFQQAGK